MVERLIAYSYHGTNQGQAESHGIRRVQRDADELFNDIAGKYSAHNLDPELRAWRKAVAVAKFPVTTKRFISCATKRASSAATSVASAVKDRHPSIVRNTESGDAASSEKESEPELDADGEERIPFVVGGDFSLGEVRLIYDKDSHRPLVRYYVDETRSRRSRANAAMPVVGRPITGIWLMNDTDHSDTAKRSATVIRTSWMESITVRSEAKYEGRHVGHVHPKAYVRNGETFSFIGEPEVVEWRDDQTGEVYDIKFYKLADRPGWVHDFHHDYPLTKTILLNRWQQASEDKWHFASTMQDELLAHKVLTLNAPTLLSQHPTNTMKNVDLDEFDDDKGDDDSDGGERAVSLGGDDNNGEEILDVDAVVAVERAPANGVVLNSAQVRGLQKKKEDATCCSFKPKKEHDRMLDVDGIEHIESRVDRFGMSVCQVLQVHWIKIMSTSVRGSSSKADGERTQDEMKYGEEATTEDEEAMSKTSYEVIVYVAIPKRDPDTKAEYIEVAEVHLDQVWVIPAYPCGWVLSTDERMWHDLQRQAEKLRRAWKPTEHWSYLDRRADDRLRKKMEKSFYISANVKHVEPGVGGNICPLKQKRKWGFNRAGGGDMSFHPLGVPTDMSFINDLHASFFQHRTDPVTGIKYANQAVQQQKKDNMGEVRLIMLLQDDEMDNGTTELWLRVVEARGLMPADSNGGSDPYVEVYLCDDEGDRLPNVKKHRSSVRDNTLRPYWNTKMVLGRNQLYNVETVGLRVDMYDHDQGGLFGWNRDDCIGSTYFPMWEMRLSTTRASDLWAPMHVNLGSKYSLLHSLHLDAKLQQFWDNKKYELMSSVQQKLDVVGKRWAWDVVGDPWMPAPVKYLLGKLILGIFHEVRELVEGILKKQIGIKSVANHQKPSSNVISKVDSTTTLICGGHSILAWIRYHLDPYDKDIWQRFNDPYFVGLLILGVIPSYGLQTMVFLFKICVIDRTDDFQLLTYITTFKGLQFLAGLWSTGQGVFQYMSCTSSSTHTCATHGPGMGNQICTLNFGRGDFMEDRTCAIITLWEFILKVAICYYAFYCMKFSTSTVGKLRIDERLVGAIISFPKDYKGETYGRRAAHVGKGRVQLQETQARVQRFNASTCEHQIVFLHDPKKKSACCGGSKEHKIPVDALARSPEFEALRREFLAARKEAESIDAKDLRILVDQNHGGEQCPFLRTLQAVGRLCELLPDGRWRTNVGADLDLLWGEIKELVNSGKLMEGIANGSPLGHVEEYKIDRYINIAEECLEIDFSEDESGGTVEMQVVMKLRMWASRYIDLARHALSATSQDILDLDLRKVHFRVICPPGMKRSPINTMWNWDIGVFTVIAVGFTIFGVYHRFNLKSWHLQSLMYWARTLYMLLSVPFLALRIPGLNLVITHAQRTGYNTSGAVVKFAKTKLPFDACEDVLNPWTPEEDAFLRNEVERYVDTLSKNIPQSRIRWGNHHDRHPADLIDWEALACSNHHKDRSADDLQNRARLLFEGDLGFKVDVERTSPTQRPWTRDDDEKCREAVAVFKLDRWSALTNASMPVLTPREKSDLLKVQREYNQAEDKYHKNESNRETAAKTKRVLDKKKEELRAHKKWYKARKDLCKWELVADYVNGDIILHKGRWCGPLYETKDVQITTHQESLVESPEKMKTETRDYVDEDDEEALLHPVLDDNRLDAAACRHRWSTVLEPGLFKVLKARADVIGT